jgi:urease accessory protein
MSSIDPRLLVWLAPSFPVGAFAYSHGLELAAERGWVRGRTGLEAWIGALAEAGSLRNDLILVAEAWTATAADDRPRLVAVNELALALQPSAERHGETVTQGNAFVSVMLTAWSAGADICALRALTTGDAAYPIAVGAATAAHAMALEGTLVAYAIAFAGNLVSAAIRLSIVGQTDGQRVMADLMPKLTSAAHRAAGSTLDDLGSATLASDLASLAHETQYSRLFRS